MGEGNQHRVPQGAGSRHVRRAPRATFQPSRPLPGPGPGWIGSCGPVGSRARSRGAGAAGVGVSASRSRSRRTAVSVGTRRPPARLRSCWPPAARRARTPRSTRRHGGSPARHRRERQVDDRRACVAIGFCTREARTPDNGPPGPPAAAAAGRGLRPAGGASGPRARGVPAAPGTRARAQAAGGLAAIRLAKRRHHTPDPEHEHTPALPRTPRVEPTDPLEPSPTPCLPYASRLTITSALLTSAASASPRPFTHPAPTSPSLPIASSRSPSRLACRRPAPQPASTRLG
jgi:hypothetical protein